MVSPGNFSPHPLTLLSFFPSIALGSQVCTLYTYLSARNTLYRTGSLGVEDLFFYFIFKYVYMLGWEGYVHTSMDRSRGQTRATDRGYLGALGNNLT